LLVRRLGGAGPSVTHLELLARTTWARRIAAHVGIGVVGFARRLTGCRNRAVLGWRRVAERPAGTSLTGQALCFDLWANCRRLLDYRRSRELLVLDWVHGHAWAVGVRAGFDEVLAIMTVPTGDLGPIGSDLNGLAVGVGDDPNHRGFLHLDIEVEDVADDLLHKGFHHGVKHVPTLPLVFDQRIALRHGPQADAFAEVVHL